MAPRRAVGLLLIAIGSALLLVLTTDLSGEIVVPLLGLGFLAAYALTNAYGLLIPGAILTGLGTGIMVAGQGGPQEAVVLGLGTGFLVIGVVDRLRGTAGSGWWWPFIPGAVLTITGASTLTGLRHLDRFVFPGILIVVGVVLMARRSPASDDREREEAST